MVTLNLDFGMIRGLFRRTEGKQFSGERPYFSERKMLSEVYNQLPDDYQETIKKEYPLTYKQLSESGMIKDGRLISAY